MKIEGLYLGDIVGPNYDKAVTKGHVVYVAFLHLDFRFRFY